MTRRWRWALAVSYLLLLAASHAVRWWRPEVTRLPAGMKVAELARVDGAAGAGGGSAPAVRLAYREWRPAVDGEAAPVLLLLHGSPGSSADFATLAPPLSRRFRVIAPDLPGFGASTHDVPDYSLRAHARYALELLDRLGIARAHVLGFSMGGGVAIDLAALAPARVRSLVLLSAIGVQELELLGDYHLNHAVHGLQLAFLWALREAVPHFGALDDVMLGVPYARNFYDSDQRPLRAALLAYQGPMLILHGLGDVLVPVAAAREHHRLVPQSELLLARANHFMVFRGGPRLAPSIDAFLRRVDEGLAPTRASVEEAARRRADLPFDAHGVPRARGVTLLVLMGLIALATLVSEDLTSIATGLLVAHGRIGFLAGTLACAAGILGGDLLIFWAGRLLGRPWLSRAPLKWVLSPERVRAASEWFERRGRVVIFLSRFTPGTRLATYFAAGLLHTRFLAFLAYFSLAVAVWTPLLVALAMWLGARALDTFALFQRWALPGLVVLAVAVWLLLAGGRALASHRGRRRLVGWWRRKVRWELWPPWAFYPPVVLWVGWLALRHRGLTVFTAANPGMPAGGFLGESKADILDHLPRERVARYQRLPAGLAPAERLARLRRFLDDEGLALPVVLKPDVGQRGAGVVIARTWERVGEALAAAPAEELIAQEYVAGPELGIFYVRRPGEERGAIFSITEKRLPVLRGDGRRTVEELVLDDPRAVALAGLYLERLAARRDEVPAAGAEVPLAELGTHCRGAVFLDGHRFASAALVEAIERISRPFDGFFFGRYDVKAPSAEAFLLGRDLKVLELNGVTSEATHIYDPANRLLDAYRVLFRQWCLAFEIGAANRARGVRPAALGPLLQELARFWLGRGGRRRRSTR